MINTYYGTKILNAFFNTAYQSKYTTWFNAMQGNNSQAKEDAAEALAENKVDFPIEPYLALFTTMPNADGAGYAEPTVADYNRVSLTQKGPAGSQIMATAGTEAGTGEYAGKNVAVVKNQDIIVYPENATEDYNAPVVGFGVFSAKTGGTLLLWGELTSPVTIEEGEIPVFRVEEFVFKLA